MIHAASDGMMARRTRRSSSLGSESSLATVRASMTTVFIPEHRKGIRARLAAQFRNTMQQDYVLFGIVPTLFLPLVAFGLHVYLVSLDSENMWVYLEIRDPVQIRATLDILTRDLVIILSLLVTASFITLQMFASQFLPHTISLFFRNRNVYICLGFYIVSILFSCFADVFIGNLYLPRIHLIATYIIRFVSLSLTLPFFSFLISFLSPEALIRQVCKDGLDLIDMVVMQERKQAFGSKWGSFAPSMRVIPDGVHKLPDKDCSDSSIARLQVEWINAIELIADIGLSTLKHKDKESSNLAMLSLYSIACSYSRVKQKLPSSWFVLSDKVRSCPDFSSLASVSLEKMIAERYWAEFKILRAYQLLFETASSLNSPHLAGLGAFYTRKLGELAADLGDRATIELASRFFNSYIRYLVNARDIRVLSGVLNEYREYALEVMRLGKAFKSMTSSNDGSQSSGFSRPEKPRRFSQPPKFSSIAKNSTFGSSLFKLSPAKASDKYKPANHETVTPSCPSGSILYEPRNPSDANVRRGSAKARLARGFRRSVFNKWGGASRTVRDCSMSQKDMAAFVVKSNACHSALMSIIIHLRFYLMLSSSKNIGVIAEIIAHDVGTLCAEAYQLGSEKHEEMLTIFLSLDDTQTSSCQIGTHRGIRRAQVKLAAMYLVHGEVGFAKEIQSDMDEEPLFRVRHIYREIMSMETESFWEITFRSQNLDYLPPEYRKTLRTFFSWFSNYSFEQVSHHADVLKSSMVNSAPSPNHGGNGTLHDNSEADRRRLNTVTLPRLGEHSSTHRKAPFMTRVVTTLRRTVREHLCAPEGTLRAILKYSALLGAFIVVALSLDSSGIAGATIRASGQREANTLLGNVAVGGVLTYVLLCVTSMIILQLVAARYKFHPEMLSFLRDPVLFAILALLLITCMLTTLTNMWNVGDFTPNSSISFLTVLVSLDVVLAGVYFRRLFLVLQPEGILCRVRERAFWHILQGAMLAKGIKPLLQLTEPIIKRRASTMSYLRRAKSKLGGVEEVDNISEVESDSEDDACNSPASAGTAHQQQQEKGPNVQVLLERQMKLESLVKNHQFQAHEHMKRICDFGFACVQQSDETNLMSAITTLRWLVENYFQVKRKLPDVWFEVSGKLRRTSDFINFSSKRVRRVSETKVWFEWKVLAQYLLIFEECIQGKRTEACQFISLNTRFIAETFLRQNDIEAYKVATNFINTFLRRAINSANLQVANYLVVQYQKLLTVILFTKCNGGEDRNVAKWGKLVSEQSWFLKYYAQVGLERGYGVLSETVAMSLGEVCSLTHKQHEEIHTEILKMLLTIDDVAEQNADSLIGIRRAQVKLATVYLCSDLEVYANMIAKDFLDESHYRLVTVVEELLTTNRPEFWEVTDHGVPFEFLEDREKMQLERFFEMVEKERQKAGKTEHVSQLSITEVVRRARTNNETEVQHGFRPRTLKETTLVSRRASIDRRLASNGFSSAQFGRRLSSALGSSKAGNIRQSLSTGGTDAVLDDFLDALFSNVAHGNHGVVVYNLKRFALPVLVGMSMVVSLVLITFFLDGDLNASKLAAALYKTQNRGDQTLSMEMVLRTFSVIIMCSLIALQKSAARMVRHVWNLYRDNKWVRLTVIGNTTAIILALWNVSMAEERPTMSIVVLLLSSFSILTMYSYFSYFFVFLDENKLLEHIVLNDLSMLSAVSGERERMVADNVDGLVSSIQRVTDFASSTIRVKDKNNSYKCVTSLYCIGRCYLNVKCRLPNRFFSQFLDNNVISTSTDFSRLTGGFKNMILQDQTWVEWKLLRQYLLLYQESIGYLTDVCYKIVISTKQLGEVGLAKGDVAVLDLCIKFLNTFLKEALERRQMRLAFSITFQYRKLAENILHSRILSTASNLTQADYARYVIDIAWYFRYYSLQAQRRGMGFMTDLISHDISLLCMGASERNSKKCHERLLDVLFKLYDKSHSGSRRGIRRAHLKLAAFYYATKREKYAKQVMAEVATETNVADVTDAYVDLSSASELSTKFHEVNERMYNIDSMPPHHRSALSRLLDYLSPELKAACLTASEGSRRTRIEFQKASMKSARSGSSHEDRRGVGLEAAFASFSREVSVRARAAINAVSAACGLDVKKSTKRSNELSGLLKISWVPIVVIGPLSIFLCLLASGVDELLGVGNNWGYFSTEYSVHDKQRVIKMLAKSSIIIFCIVLTPTLIMLQINSRYLLGVIADQYFNDRRVYSLLMYYAISSTFVLWVHHMTTESYTPVTAMVFSVWLVLSMIVLLFPYFGILFEFLDPNKVVGRMLQEALSNVHQCNLAHERDDGGQFADTVAGCQHKTNLILQQLAGFAGASIQEKDKYNFTNVVRVLSEFVDEYLTVKNKLHSLWFDATVKSIRNSHDFSSFNFELLEALKEDRCWVESKILRQFLELYNESLLHMEDGALLIAIETVKMGQKAIEMHDHDAIEHITTMFNTYIRSCINNRQIRSVYNTLHQYRQFAELLIVSNGQSIGLTRIAYNIAKYFRYYGVIAVNMKLTFVVETIVFDMSSMCETAFLLAFDNNVTNDRILTEMLSLFDIFHINSEKEKENVCNANDTVLDSIGRACCKLATMYLEMDDVPRAMLIARKLKSVCTKELLTRIHGKLECVTERVYWEVNDRQSNFDYIPEGRRGYLVEFFRLCTSDEAYDQSFNVKKPHQQAMILTKEDVDVLGDPTSSGKYGSAKLISRVDSSHSAAVMNDSFRERKAKQEEEQKTASFGTIAEGASVSALALGAAMMKRKMMEARRKLEQRRQRQTEARDSDTSSLGRTQGPDVRWRRETLKRMLSNVEQEWGDEIYKQSTRAVFSFDEQALTKKLSGSDEGKEKHHPDSRLSSVGKITEAQMLRESRRGSAANLNQLLKGRQEIEDLPTTQRRKFRASMFSSYDEKKARVSKQDKASERMDKDEEASRAGAQVWDAALYIVPGVFLGTLVFVMLVECAVESTCHALMDPLYGLSNNSDYTKFKADTLSTMAVILITFLGCIVTVSTIVLQILSTRYTPRISALFARNKSIVASLIVFFSSASFIVLQASIASNSYVSPVGYGMSLLAFTISFLLLMPYVGSLLRFLDASKIFKDIANDGLSNALRWKGKLPSVDLSSQFNFNITSKIGAALSSTSRSGAPVEVARSILDGTSDETPEDKEARAKRQLHVLGALDQLSFYTLSALRVKDKRNAFNGIDLISAFCIGYLNGYAKGNSQVSGVEKASRYLVLDPDFCSLSDQVITEFEQKQLWVIWKGLRGVLKMFEVSLLDFSDGIAKICRSLRHVGQASIRCNHFPAAVLTVKFLNTVLQLSITKGDTRAADTITLQYRFFLEFLINTLRRSYSSALSTIVTDMVNYLFHYASFSLAKLQVQTCENILHDICTLASFARAMNQAEIHEFLINGIQAFLIEIDVDTPAGTTGLTRIDYVPRGVLRAVIKLSCVYVAEFGDALTIEDEDEDESISEETKDSYEVDQENKEESDARRLFLMLKDLHVTTLKALWVEFKMLGASEYWEVTNRSSNVDSLSLPQKKALVRFYYMYEQFTLDLLDSKTERAKHLANLKQQNNHGQ